MQKSLQTLQRSLPRQVKRLQKCYKILGRSGMQKWLVVESQLRQDLWKMLNCFWFLHVSKTDWTNHYCKNTCGIYSWNLFTFCWFSQLLSINWQKLQRLFICILTTFIEQAGMESKRILITKRRTCLSSFDVQKNVVQVCSFDE